MDSTWVEILNNRIKEGRELVKTGKIPSGEYYAWLCGSYHVVLEKVLGIELDDELPVEEK